MRKIRNVLEQASPIAGRADPKVAGVSRVRPPEHAPEHGISLNKPAKITGADALVTSQCPDNVVKDLARSPMAPVYAVDEFALWSRDANLVLVPSRPSMAALCLPIQPIKLDLELGVRKARDLPHGVVPVDHADEHNRRAWRAAPARYLTGHGSHDGMAS